MTHCRQNVSCSSKQANVVRNQSAHLTSSTDSSQELVPSPAREPVRFYWALLYLSETVTWILMVTVKAVSVAGQYKC